MCVCGHDEHENECHCGCMTFELCPDLDKYSWGMSYGFGASIRTDKPYPISIPK